MKKEQTRPRWAHLVGNNPWVPPEPASAAAIEVVGTESPSPVASTAGASGSILRSSALVGVGTALSRLSGLARTAALTYALGGLVLADAYNLANTTPNIVYDLVLGGILSATLVPFFVDRFDDGDQDGVDAVVTVAVVALVALTVTAVAAAPWIFRLYTWAAGDDQAQLEQVGVPLLRLFLPQVLFYGLTALATGLLNARRRFAAPAFAPVLNNAVLCGVLLMFAHLVGDSPTAEEVAGDRGLLWLLGAGTTAGIVAMTVVLWPALRRAGVRWRWHWQPRHPGVRRVASLSGWTLGYVVANQVAFAVVLALAARQSGGAAAYTYAFVFFQLPYGLFAVSLMTTLTPELAAAASGRDTEGFRARFSFGLRLMTLVVLPASVGMAVLARPLVSGLLGHGAFGGDAPQLTADVLANFAGGLLGFSVYLFALRGFYALGDTRTPFLLNLAQNALNIVFAVALVGRFGVQGLAFAFSLAYAVAAVMALAALRARVGRLGGRAVVDSSVRIAVAAAVMGAAVLVVSRVVGSPAGLGALVRMGAGVLVGIIAFAAAAVAVGVEEVDAIRSRLGRAPSGPGRSAP